MRRVANVSAQWPPVYLAIGDSLDIIANFTLQTGLTSVDVAFGSGSGSFSSNSNALDPTSALEFVFMWSNADQTQAQSASGL